jgi:hypothetical protein
VNAAFAIPNLLARPWPRRIRAPRIGEIFAVIEITQYNPAFVLWSGSKFPRVPSPGLPMKIAQLTQQKGHRYDPMAFKLGAGVGFEPTTFRL